MKIVVMLNGKPKGPFDLDVVKRAIQRGELSPSALGWHEGQDKWTELQKITSTQRHHLFLAAPSWN